MEYPWHYYLMAALYVVAGFNHFRKPKMYQNIIPPYLPNPKLLNIISGFAEIVFGSLLLLHLLQNIALYGIIIMLIAFFPVHVYMVTEPKFRAKIPFWILWVRLPLQFLLIYWAYSYL